jgi:hypothetical protein
MKSKRRSIKTSADLVRAFADLFDAIELESPEEIDEVLHEAGYDPDVLGERMRTAAQLASETLRNRQEAHNG